MFVWQAIPPDTALTQVAQTFMNSSESARECFRVVTHLHKDVMHFYLVLRTSYELALSQAETQGSINVLETGSGRVSNTAEF